MALAVCLVSYSSQTCNRCMENNIACVNETHFKYCINSSPISDQVLPCGAGKVCTDLGVLCIDETIGQPACPADEVDCKSCDGSVLLVCTSRTTFQMCNGTALTGQTLTCPTDTFCSITSGEFCVKECALPNGKYDCDKDAP